ncbi:hypothetical protein ACFLU5_13115 [Bacteroidota bacterium]
MIQIVIKKIKRSFGVLLCIIVFLPYCDLRAQNEKLFPRELSEEDTVTLEALALYPEEDRLAIFELCKYPQILVSLDAGQTKSQTKFQNLIAGFEREDQEKFYELIRYPGLIEGLISGGKKSKTEISELLKEYPEDIHETALDFGRSQYATLEKINELSINIKKGFQDLIAGYPEETKEAAHRLIKFPEALTLLVDNLNLTIMIGEAYRNSPGTLVEKANAYSLELARQNAEELADYQEQLKEDPEAYQEMVAAAEQYAEDNGIENVKEPVASESEVHVVHHYPYWFGYPYWYSTPIWTPVPWYYHTGFYYGPGGAVVFIGMPSPYYVGWHHAHYPNTYVHLSFHYHRHYHRHPYSHTSFHQSVNVHVNRNTNVNINRNVYANQNINMTGTRSNQNVNRNTQRTNQNVNRNTQRANQNVNQANRNTQTRTNVPSSSQRKPGTTTSRSSYNQHRATQSHQQSWSGSSRSSYSKPTRSAPPTRSGTRGRRR